MFQLCLIIAHKIKLCEADRRATVSEKYPNAVECINCLDGYGFDMNVRDESAFGREYLSRNLPTEFDLSVLEDIDLYDFGSKVLKCKGTNLTSYGVIYGKEQDLYSAIAVEQELSEECEEELTEDESQDFNFETEMGV